MAPNDAPGLRLPPAERDHLAALRSATSVSDLLDLTGADDEREAYLAARREWAALRGRELAAASSGETSGGETSGGCGAGEDDVGVPGNCVTVDGRRFWVHGVTHADTDAERSYLREHVSRWLDRDAAVYCEQGIRRMYFADLPGVCEMDDLSWAVQRCEERAPAFPVTGAAGSVLADLAGADVADAAESAAADVAGAVESLADRFRNAAFALAASRSDADGIGVALGGLASALLTSHGDAAVGDDFESFAKTRRASRDPDALVDLQEFYEKTFLPQPVEREWLRRHDPELELLTHARNERMAEYAVVHAEADEVHLVVGAAHQPGVTYYLERVRDGERSVEDFEFVA